MKVKIQSLSSENAIKKAKEKIRQAKEELKKLLKK